jgi:hypothetical protein
VIALIVAAIVAIGGVVLLRSRRKTSDERE